MVKGRAGPMSIHERDAVEVNRSYCSIISSQQFWLKTCSRARKGLSYICNTELSSDQQASCRVCPRKALKTSGVLRACCVACNLGQLSLPYACIQQRNTSYA